MRWRLLGSFILIILIALGTVAVVTRYTTQQEVQTFLGHGGQAGLENLANVLRSYYATNQTWDGVDTQIRGSQGRGQGMRANANVFLGDHILADSSGVILFGPTTADVGTVLPREVLDQSIPLAVSGAVVGYLVPEGGILQLPENFEELLIERVNRATLLAALVSGGLAILLSFLFAALILKPVRSLTHAAEKMVGGDFSQRVKIREGGELGTLGETFNQMSESLLEAELQRKALTADIAHELRNPLAIQRAHLEALQDGVFPLNRDNLNPVVEQNQQLTRLVDDLRTLALADAGELALNKRPINLSDICRETAARFEPQAALKKLNLVADCVASPLYAIADKERLQQIHDNLLQNALRYAPEGGWIKLSLRQEGKWGVFTVHNNGPQIPEETLGHLFERFYRGDKARDRASGGTGLGLAIARKLAEAHGGTLTGANHPEGGVVFTLSLPL